VNAVKRLILMQQLIAVILLNRNEIKKPALKMQASK